MAKLIITSSQLKVHSVYDYEVLFPQNKNNIHSVLLSC